MAKKKNKVTVKKEGWKKLLQRVKRVGDAKVAIGVLADRGGEEIHTGKGNITLLELAAIHEFGSPAAHVPERSFIRGAFDDPEYRDELRAAEKQAAKLYINGKPLEACLELIGMAAVAVIRRRITAHIPPPLKPETIKRKTRKDGKTGDVPLVDTGQLINAISYEVRPQVRSKGKG